VASGRPLVTRRPSMLRSRDYITCNFRNVRVGLVFVALVIIGCSIPDRRLSRGSFDAFGELTFVGAGPCQREGDRATALPKHGAAELALPDRPKVGVAYVFHSPRPVNAEDLAIVVFPARLKSAGVTVVSGPKSSHDLIYPFLGDAIFTLH
jgi:hypothetical protein